MKVYTAIPSSATSCAKRQTNKHTEPNSHRSASEEQIFWGNIISNTITASTDKGQKKVPYLYHRSSIQSKTSCCYHAMVQMVRNRERPRAGCTTKKRWTFKDSLELPDGSAFSCISCLSHLTLQQKMLFRAKLLFKGV